MENSAVPWGWPEDARIDLPFRSVRSGQAGGTVARPLGWIVLIAWLTAVAGFALWQWILSPETLFERVLVAGGVTGFLLLFLSVLLDRIKSYKNDKYRGVKR